MAILDIFKRKKPEIKPAAIPEVSKMPQKPGGVPETAYRVLKRPHVTEKATDLTKANQYIFEVYPDANKNEIKRAVGDLYGVDVVSVRVVNIPAKRRMVKRVEGWKPGYKKAIVRIKEGQKIEVLPR